jgi:hypothetical protein
LTSILVGGVMIGIKLLLLVVIVGLVIVSRHDALLGTPWSHKHGVGVYSCTPRC